MIDECCRVGVVMWDGQVRVHGEGATGEDYLTNIIRTAMVTMNEDDEEEIRNGGVLLYEGKWSIEDGLNCAPYHTNHDCTKISA